MTDSTTLALDDPRGYQRTIEAQERFDEAAESLRVADGWVNPATGRPELRADLVLEGCGVKASGLVGAVMALSEAGYSMRAVAGTSAGAVVASLVAGITQAGQPMSSLLQHAVTLDFKKFMMPNGKIHDFFDRATGRVGTMLADAAMLTEKTGLYSGDYLEDWLRPILHDQLGIKTFADLKLSADDPEVSLAPGRDYRLVVMTSDITRGQVARLPWDYPLYGHDPDTEDPVKAVRASMSIPFIFEPVHFVSRDATVEVAGPGGASTSVHYAGGHHTWVDGALLENFPIHTFDRVDAQPARWPTIGVRLSRLATDVPAGEACGSALEVAMHCLRATMNDWDANALHERTAGRTVYVDNAGLNATDFDVPMTRQYDLFLNGVRAASDFIVASAAAGGVPRT